MVLCVSIYMRNFFLYLLPIIRNLFDKFYSQKNLL